MEFPANWAGSFRNAAFLMSPMLGLGFFIHAAASESPYPCKQPHNRLGWNPFVSLLLVTYLGKQMFVHVFPRKLMQQKVRLMH